MQHTAFDPRAVTFTDSDGDEQNAYEYLMEDGDLACFSRYGSRSSDCAPVACLLFAIQVDAGCEDSIDGLDGAMSLVVNSHDDVETLIRDYAPILGADPDDYLDD